MKRALIVVAHPDDETIWAGGMILRNSDWQWTILSLCRKNDSDRAPKFLRVCESYNARGIIGDLDDEKLTPLTEQEIKEKILSLVPERDYDFIYTHGSNGEYGHLRHKEIHKAVLSLIKEEELSCNKLLCFSYSPGKKTVPGNSDLHIAEPKEEKEIILLNGKEYKKKIQLIQKLYGFSPNSFESLCCCKMEAFKEC